MKHSNHIPPVRSTREFYFFYYKCFKTIGGYSFLCKFLSKPMPSTTKIYSTETSEARNVLSLESNYQTLMVLGFFFT